jgi:flagellar hook-associated protein FlgK
MNSILGIAQSGLQVASLELAVSANNVANAETDGFVPSRVVEKEVPGGGVSGDVQRESDPLAEARADRALLAPSRTDLVQEILAQAKAVAVYRANLASLRVGDESAGAMLDVTR